MGWRTGVMNRERTTAAAALHGAPGAGLAPNRSDTGMSSVCGKNGPNGSLVKAVCGFRGAWAREAEAMRMVNACIVGDFRKTEPGMKRGIVNELLVKTQEGNEV